MGDVWNVGEDDRVPDSFFDTLYEPGVEYVHSDQLTPEDDIEEVELEILEEEPHPPRHPHITQPPQTPSPPASPVAPAFSPITPPRRREAAGTSRDRSRSPHDRRGDELHLSRDPEPPASSGIVLAIFDEDLHRMDDQDALYLNVDVREEVNQIDRVNDERDEDERNARRRNENESVVGEMDAGEMNVDDSVRGRRNVRIRVQGGRGGRSRGRGRAQRVGRGGGRRSRVGDSRWVVGHPLEEIWTNDDDVPSELRDMVMDIVRRREMRAQEMRNRQVRNAEERERLNDGEHSESEDEDEQEFQDAIDGRDNPFLEGESPRFEWSSMETFRPTEELFTQETTGSVNCYSAPYDAFRSYWDDSILNLIVDETNKYAQRITSPSFQNEWYPTNSDEVLCLFSFWIMLGIVRMPTIRSCFAQDPLLKTEIFRKLFTCNRYEALCRALHFVEGGPATFDACPTTSEPAASSDRLYRLRPILDHLNAKFQANYILSKDICIDESLTLWKGRLNIRQYIRSKAAKFGIKKFELCESSTGYLWSFFVYTGRHSSLDLPYDPRVLKSTAIVQKLIGPLLHKGYRLFMDNWYNSPLLARFLKCNGTDCVGTLRPCRQDVPVLINKAPLRQGQLIARHSGDVCVLSWQDKKRITMISTCHGSATGLAQASKPTARPLPFKPQVVLDYNKSMGGVDLKDQMLEPYLIERKKCAKWYMKLFKRLLNVSILNARILLESSAQCRQDHLNFRLQLVGSILVNHLADCPLGRRRLGAISRMPDPCRRTPHIHWPVHLQPPGSIPVGGRNIRSRCNVCVREGRIRKKTTFKCEACNVPLCVDYCFKAYHTT